MQAQAEPTARISNIVGAFLAKRGGAPKVDLKQDLMNAGLSSLDLVNLMLAVEGEFDVFIPEEKMTPEHFRTISSIEALVVSLR